MSGLLETLLSDGFGCLLLSAFAAPGKATAHVAGIVFIGGREQSRFGPFITSVFEPAPEVRRAIRTAVIEAASCPDGFFTAGFGTAVSALYSQSVPDLVAQAPCTRFEPVAAAVLGLHPRCSPAEIAAATGVAIRQAEGTAAPDMDALGEIFWNVVAEADRRHLAGTTVELRLLPERRREIASAGSAVVQTFESITASAPAAPGVYILRDASGTVLYVGSTTNLERRLNEHFRAAALPPPKKQVLVRDARSCEVRVTGSGLEALLTEARLIDALTPRLNVVRRLHPRRTPAPETRGIVCASVAQGRVELFLYRAGVSALQVRADPRRPPRKRILDSLRYLDGASGRPPRGNGVTEWGLDGAEICARYFSRFHDRLVTVAADGLPERAAEDISTMLRHLDPAQIAKESAEYRAISLSDLC